MDGEIWRGETVEYRRESVKRKPGLGEGQYVKLVVGDSFLDGGWFVKLRCDRCSGPDVQMREIDRSK